MTTPVTAVWGVLIFMVASEANSDAQLLFLIFWVRPVLIWWGIHRIKSLITQPHQRELSASIIGSAAKFRNLSEKRASLNR